MAIWLNARLYLRLVAGHAMDAATAGADRVNVQLHHFAVRVELGQQLKGPAIGCPVTKLRRQHGAVDHEVVDVAGGKIRVVFTELVVVCKRGQIYLAPDLIGSRQINLSPLGKVLQPDKRPR